MSSTAIAQKPQFSVAIQTDTYKKLINNTLQDPKKAQRFVASVSAAVAVNPALRECDAGTILTCALLGECLDLSPSPQLGQYYLVPFEDRKNNRKVATFILGYKGYIQLAIRSGQYKNINVLAIKKGELKSYNPLTEELEVEFMQDELERETAETTGYYAMFEYINGFRKAMYWSKDKMERHALRYSKGYSAKKGYTFWEREFDGMAFKTMLRQLISKWGVMSIEMRQALESDDTCIKPDLTPDYITDAQEAPQINAMPDDEEAPPVEGSDGNTPQVSMKDL
jgi:recombination protein RecT